MFPYYFFHEGVEHARRVFVGVGPLQIADDALGDPEGHPYSTVVGNLKMVYFRLAYVQQTLGVPQRSDTLLTQAQEADEARYLVGQGNEHDVLKAPLQHTKILQEIAHHHQGEGLLEAQIKQVLGRPRESEDIVADTLTLRTPAYAAAASCSGLASRIPTCTQNRPPSI